MASVDTLRLLARIFSRPVYRDLAMGRLGVPLRSALRHCRAYIDIERATARSVFEQAYAALLASYRSEYIYKNTIVQKAIFGHHSPATAAFLTEFNVNESKADAVVLNGTSSVYEIKTEYDSFSRLLTQISDYGRVFDLLTVVTHDQGIAAVEKIVPSHVGISVLSRRGHLRKIRPATSNIANTNVEMMFRCLRRAEYQNILIRRFGGFPNVAPGFLWEACLNEFRKLENNIAHAEMVVELRKRTTDPAKVAFVKALPAPLRTLGFAEPLSKIRAAELLTNLELPLNALK
ncbi:sce7726 family protein [Cupriavidus sp. JZ107]